MPNDWRTNNKKEGGWGGWWWEEGQDPSQSSKAWRQARGRIYTLAAQEPATSPWGTVKGDNWALKEWRGKSVKRWGRVGGMEDGRGVVVVMRACVSEKPSSSKPN